MQVKFLLISTQLKTRLFTKSQASRIIVQEKCQTGHYGEYGVNKAC